jgi:ankyrin repeat protein
MSFFSSLTSAMGMTAQPAPAAAAVEKTELGRASKQKEQPQQSKAKAEAKAKAEPKQSKAKPGAKAKAQPQQQKQNSSLNIDVLQACEEDNQNALETAIMKQQGLDVNWSEALEGVSPASVCAQKGHEKCLSIIAKHKFNLAKANKQGLAPIHAASNMGSYACCQILLDNGVNMNLRTTGANGYTAVMTACQVGNVSVC